jgi:hypothetical protein
VPHARAPSRRLVEAIRRKRRSQIHVLESRQLSSAGYKEMLSDIAVWVTSLYLGVRRACVRKVTIDVEMKMR